MTEAPFPITISGYDHHAWRKWCLALPFVVVADAEKKPLEWMHHEDLKPCKNVVVGVYGIPQEIAAIWTFSRLPLTPSMVSDALASVAVTL